MLAAHIYLNGQCTEAMRVYQSAFGATVQTAIEDPENSELILHAKILIHGQLLILNDYGGGLDLSKSGGYQLSVQFDNKDELLAAYSVLEAGCTIVFPLQPTGYSPCVVRLVDRFDVRWALWI
jgi:PhnB protein